MMKHTRLIISSAVVLFFVGFFSQFFIVKLSERFLSYKLVTLSTTETVKTGVSLGLLSAFCAVTAGIVLWAYSKSHSSYSPMKVFALGLFVSIVSAVIGVWFNLFELRYALLNLGPHIESDGINLGSLDYFNWGAGLPFFICGINVLYFLWISRKQNNAN